MKLTRYFRIIALILAASFLLTAFWEKKLWIGSGIAVLWIALWWYSQIFDWVYSPSVFFTGYISACVIGLFFGLQPMLLSGGVTAALTSWDFDRFYRRWKDAEPGTDLRNVEKRHLLRILAVDGIGVILSVAGYSLKARLNFGIMLLVGVLAVMSLSWVVNLLKSPGRKDKQKS